MPARPSHRGRTLLACALAATLAVLGAGMPAASAHDELVATTPAQGTTVAASPATVTLEFSRPVQPLGAQVVVTGPGGAPVSQDAAELRDATVTQPVPAEAPPGAYTVSWRVTAADGHLLTGEFAFTVAGTEQVADAGDAVVSETAAQQPLGSAPPYGGMAVGAGLLLAAGLVLVLRRRRT